LSCSSSFWVSFLIYILADALHIVLHSFCGSGLQGNASWQENTYFIFCIIVLFRLCMTNQFLNVNIQHFGNASIHLLSHAQSYAMSMRMQRCQAKYYLSTKKSIVKSTNRDIAAASRLSSLLVNEDFTTDEIKHAARWSILLTGLSAGRLFKIAALPCNAVIAALAYA